jgi:hypothetical protein
MMLGMWKSFVDLEENISLPELTELLDFKRQQEEKERIFLAGLQGIDMRDNTDDDDVARIKREVEAELRGVSTEQLEFEMAGFEVIIED